MDLPLSDHEAAQARPWNLPPLGAAATGKRAGPRTAGHLDDLETSAREEGFSRGYQDGHAAGLRAAKTVIEQLRGLLDNLSQPLQQLDATVEEQLVTLTLELARELAQHELRTRPEALTRVIQEAVRSVQPAPREVRVHLNPADLAALKPLLLAAPAQSNWVLVANDTLSPGDCRVVADASTVHAELDPRVRELARTLLGEPG